MERETPQGVEGWGAFTPPYTAEHHPPLPVHGRPTARSLHPCVWAGWGEPAGCGVPRLCGSAEPRKQRIFETISPKQFFVAGGSCRGAGLRIKRVDVWAIFGGIFFPFRPFFPVVTVFLRLYGGVLVLGMLIVKMNKNYANGCKNLQISCQNLRKYCKNALKTCG